jgi:hypothetical protein
MKGANFHVIFDKKNETKTKDIEVLVYIYCTKDSQRKYISTGVRVSKNHWKGTDGSWIKSTHPEALKLNKQIELVLRRLRDFDYMRLEKNADYDITELGNLMNA